MLMNRIINKLFIVFLVITPIKCVKKDCIAFKEARKCTEYISKDKKHPTYLSPFLSKDFHMEVNNVEDFDKSFGQINFNPIYPADSSILQEEFGCNYEPTLFQMRYAESFFCDYIFHSIDKNCNKNNRDSLPVLCNNSCLIYYDIIKSVFNNTIVCPLASEELMENRQKRLDLIKKHCDEKTSKENECLIGTGDEKGYCGYREESAKEEYCNMHQKTDPCCDVQDEPIDLLKIAKYIFIAVGVLLVVVLISLLVYSKNKNKRDEEKRIEAEELEKKRQEERDRYREQLTKELSSESLNSVNAPLLQKSDSFNLPYQSPGMSPVVSPRMTHQPQQRISPQSNPSHPPPPQHNASRGSPGSNASHPPPPQHNGSRGSPGSNASHPPPPQHNGSRGSPGSNASHPPPPQHNGSRGSPGSNASHPPPPQHSDSRNSPGIIPRQVSGRDSPRVLAHQDSKDSGRNNPIRPPFGPRDSPKESPRDSPRNKPMHGPRDSPRNSPAHGPRNSPRNSPVIHPPRSSPSAGGPSRPPPGNSRPHLPSNNNRY